MFSLSSNYYWEWSACGHRFRRWKWCQIWLKWKWNGWRIVRWQRCHCADFYNKSHYIHSIETKNGTLTFPEETYWLENGESRISGPPPKPTHLLKWRTRENSINKKRNPHIARRNILARKWWIAHLGPSSRTKTPLKMKNSLKLEKQKRNPHIPRTKSIG